MVEVTPEAEAPDGMTWQEAHTAVQLRLAKREEEMRELTKQSLQAVQISKATSENYARLARWHQHWKTRATQYQGVLAKVRRYAEANNDPALLAILGDANLAANQPCNCSPFCPVNASEPRAPWEIVRVERDAQASG